MEFQKYTLLIIIIGYIGYSLFYPNFSSDKRRNGVIIGVAALVAWFFVSQSTL